MGLFFATNYANFTKNSAKFALIREIRGSEIISKDIPYTVTLRIHKKRPTRIAVGRLLIIMAILFVD